MVKSVRIGEHPDKVRLVLDLSAPAQHVIESKDGGAVILIGLPDAGWDTKTQWTAGSGSPVLQSYDAESAEGGGSWLRLKSRGTMEVIESGSLPPNGGSGYRLYIDLRAK